MKSNRVDPILKLLSNNHSKSITRGIGFHYELFGPVRCYVPGHLAHIFLSFLDHYVLIRSHDCLPVQQSHLAGNSIVLLLCTFPIVPFLW